MVCIAPAKDTMGLTRVGAFWGLEKASTRLVLHF